MEGILCNGCADTIKRLEGVQVSSGTLSVSVYLFGRTELLNGVKSMPQLGRLQSKEWNWNVNDQFVAKALTSKKLIGFVLSELDYNSLIEFVKINASASDVSCTSTSVTQGTVTYDELLQCVYCSTKDTNGTWQLHEKMNDSPYNYILWYVPEDGKKDYDLISTLMLHATKKDLLIINNLQEWLVSRCKGCTAKQIGGGSKGNPNTKKIRILNRDRVVYISKTQGKMIRYRGIFITLTVARFLNKMNRKSKFT